MTRILKVVFLESHVIIIHEGEKETEYIIGKIIDQATDEKDDER